MYAARAMSRRPCLRMSVCYSPACKLQSGSNRIPEGDLLLRAAKSDIISRNDTPRPGSSKALFGSDRLNVTGSLTMSPQSSKNQMTECTSSALRFTMKESSADSSRKAQSGNGQHRHFLLFLTRPLGHVKKRHLSTNPPFFELVMQRSVLSPGLLPLVLFAALFFSLKSLFATLRWSSIVTRA